MLGVLHAGVTDLMVTEGFMHLLTPVQVGPFSGCSQTGRKELTLSLSLSPSLLLFLLFPGHQGDFQ